MFILKAIWRRIYWLSQDLFRHMNISILYLDPINFRIFRVSRITPELEVREFIRKFRPLNNGSELIRVGNIGDGGYLVPNDFEQLDICFSAGCDLQWSFEKDLEKLAGVRSFIIDSFDKKPFDLGVNQIYTAAWLGVTTTDKTLSLEDWVLASTSVDDNDLLLQMDIEGFEWECFSQVKIEFLKRFRIIVIEFHAIRNILNHKMFLEIYSPVIDKLKEVFDIVHFHPNNCCGMYEFKEGFTFPNVFEVTFHRKDRAIRNHGFRNLPHELDVRNISTNEDLRVFFPQT